MVSSAIQASKIEFELFNLFNNFGQWWADITWTWVEMENKLKLLKHILFFLNAKLIVLKS